MKVKFNSFTRVKDLLGRAFTLIEMLAVLAIIAILAALIVPNLLKQVDIATANQEVATLQSLGNALQSSILRNFHIPDATDWATVIGTELGLDPNNVSTNLPGKARILLIDPAFQVGTNGYGVSYYTQTINGSVNAPVSPRFMILSSISTALPTAYVSGVPATSNDFSAIWNTADGSLPPTAAFTGWNGVNYLHVQRINLSSLFVKLVLSTYASTTNGPYVLWPSLTVTNLAPTGSGVTAYYLQNSTLRLISAVNRPTNTVDSDQLLIHDASFVYYQNVWLGSISSTNFPGAGSGSVGADFISIVANFLAAPANGQALGTPQATQTLVVQDMINYLNAYDAWAASGLSPASPLYGTALTVQATMMTDINNLINGL